MTAPLPRGTRVTADRATSTGTVLHCGGGAWGGDRAPWAHVAWDGGTWTTVPLELLKPTGERVTVYTVRIKGLIYNSCPTLELAERQAMDLAKFRGYAVGVWVEPGDGSPAYESTVCVP